MESGKKVILLALVFALACGLCVAGDSPAAAGGAQEVLRVYNASEYIDRATIADFEKEFGIRVVYSEFESNEEMYAEVTRNPKGYDVLVPSDYTIDRLIKEGKLEKLDFGKIPNISNVAPQHLMDNEYVVPYMVGTLGILYNKKFVSNPVDSWESLWDPQYKGKVLMWDSQRDVLAVGLKLLGFSVNSSSDEELAQAKERLIAQRPIVKAYDTDIIRDMMIASEGYLALMYSGEAKTATDKNPYLAYVVPKEGSNKWLDGFVIVKNAENLREAYLFIDFMCRPRIAIRNMTATGYTSPIHSVWGEFCEDPIMFPSDEELARCEAFLYDKEATQKYDDVWKQVRGGRQ